MKVLFIVLSSSKQVIFIFAKSVPNHIGISVIRNWFGSLDRDLSKRTKNLNLPDTAPFLIEDYGKVTGQSGKSGNKISMIGVDGGKS